MWRLFVLAIAAAGTCRTLSFEGGGSHGAYEAGATWQLVHSLPLEEVQWDIVSGVSIGAINAGSVAIFAKGDELTMADSLVKEWENIRSADVYEDWAGGLVAGLLFQQGIYSNAPSYKYIHDTLARPFLRNITVGVTNMNEGKFYNVLNTQLSHSDMVTAIIASGSPPFFFPPVLIDGVTYADGGCLINLDVFSAINQCIAATGKEEDVVVDMVFDNQINGLDTVAREWSTLEVMWRVQKVKSYNTAISYYFNAVNAFPDVNFRYIILPQTALPGGFVPLDFTKDVLDLEIVLGKQDTKRILDSNQDTRQVIRDLYEQKRGKIRYI